jgi:hypothetical protein
MRHFSPSSWFLSALDSAQAVVETIVVKSRSNKNENVGLAGMRIWVTSLRKQTPGGVLQQNTGIDFSMTGAENVWAMDHGRILGYMCNAANTLNDQERRQLAEYFEAR